MTLMDKTLVGRFVIITTKSTISGEPDYTYVVMCDKVNNKGITGGYFTAFMDSASWQPRGLFPWYRNSTIEPV